MSRVPWGGVAAGGGLLLMAGVGGALLFLTRPFPEAPWVEVASLEAGRIYDPAAGPTGVHSPFHLEVDPMARLLLVNFEEDPDRIYLGFEPQAFDDDVHGEGLLVLGWRLDGRVDVFHSPGLRLSEATYGIAGGGLHAMVERPFEDARFRIGPRGADVDLDFTDLEDRPVHLRILETDPRPRRPFGLLAPMGAAATDPPALPLVLLHDFDFVRERGSDIRIEIDGRHHAPDRLPLPMDGARVTFVRYAPDPFIVTWNPARDAPILPLAVLPAGGEDAPGGPAEGAIRAEGQGVVYTLVPNGGHREIRSMERTSGAHTVRVDFSPAVPHLVALAEGVRVEGRFRISAHPSTGVITGRWEVSRSRDGARAGTPEGTRVHLEVVPDGGWTPRESKPVVRLLYRVVPMFREWPRTYRWQGTVEIPAGALGGEASARGPVVHLRSGWERIPPE